MEIYAELSKKMLEKINSGKLNFTFQEDISLIRNKRACFFEVNNNNKEILIEKINKFLKEHQKRRLKARKKVQRFLYKE